MSDERILVPANEAAKMLSMGRSTFWKAVKDKLLPEPVKIGGLTRWRVSDLQQHFRASQTTTASTVGAGEGTQLGCTQP
jgi:predicted DNA-binding transcriptional regulator AlpA